MKYRIFYLTDIGKRYTECIDAYSEKDAERKLRNKYNDIDTIVQITEEGA